jgi:hypothetical protein
MTLTQVESRTGRCLADDSEDRQTDWLSVCLSTSYHMSDSQWASHGEVNASAAESLRNLESGWNPDHGSLLIRLIGSAMISDLV